MTTRIRIENDKTSNGDIHIHAVNTASGTVDAMLYPGDPPFDTWISTSSNLHITERWPTAKPVATRAEAPVSHAQDHAEDQTYESKAVVHAPHEAIRDEGPDFVPSSYRP